MDLSVGDRVRVYLDGRLSGAATSERGIVTRVDARGVLVRLDSGRTVLCEPRHVEPEPEGG